MEKVIFISFLGTNIYNKAKYKFFPNDNGEEGFFGIIPYIKSCSNGNTNNKLFCIVTKEVIDERRITPREKEDYPIRGSGNEVDVNNYEYLKKTALELSENDQRLFGFDDIEKILIPIEIDGLELYNIINDKVLSSLKSDDTAVLHIDTTNCYRHIPLSMFTVLKMIEKFNKNVKIGSIVYWKTEDKGNKHFLLMNLLDTFRNTQIAEDIDVFNETFHMSGFDEQINNGNSSDVISKLNMKLKEIESNLQFANVDKLCKNIREATEIMKNIITGREENVAPVFVPYIKNLYETYNSLMNEDDVEMSVNIARELKKRNQIQVAVTFLESLFNKVMINLYQRKNPEDDHISRDYYKYNISRYIASLFGLRYMPLPDIDKKDVNKNQDTIEKINELKTDNCNKINQLASSNINDKKITDIIWEFFQQRNAMNHGKGKNSEDFNQIFNNFAETIVKINDVFKTF